MNEIALMFTNHQITRRPTTGKCLYKFRPMGTDKNIYQYFLKIDDCDKIKRKRILERLLKTFGDINS